MFNHRKKGQSTVEYIVLVSAVLLVVILFMNDQNGFKGKVNSTLLTASTQMSNAASKFAVSQTTSINSNPTSAISVNIMAP